MMLDKTFQRIKQEIIEYHRSTLPVNMPGIAFIINEEDDSVVNCAKIIKEDCDELGYHWFASNINSDTDIEFLKRMIFDFNDMEDASIVVIPFPLPNKFRKFEDEIMNDIVPKYVKINTLELVCGNATLGTRLAILGMAKEFNEALRQNFNINKRRD